MPAPNPTWKAGHYVERWTTWKGSFLSNLSLGIKTIGKDYIIEDNTTIMLLHRIYI
jgi:hypothetical protein